MKHRRTDKNAQTTSTIIENTDDLYSIWATWFFSNSKLSLSHTTWCPDSPARCWTVLLIISMWYSPRCTQYWQRVQIFKEHLNTFQHCAKCAKLIYWSFLRLKQPWRTDNYVRVASVNRSWFESLRRWAGPHSIETYWDWEIQMTFMKPLKTIWG